MRISATTGVLFYMLLAHIKTEFWQCFHILQDGLTDTYLKSLDDVYRDVYLAKYPVVGYMDYLVDQWTRKAKEDLWYIGQVLSVIGGMDIYTDSMTKVPLSCFIQKIGKIYKDTVPF